MSDSMKLAIKNATLPLEKYLKIGADAFIFGLKGFCSNEKYPKSLEEIKEIRNNYPDIEIFLSMNKCIFNEELEELEQVLKEIDTISIKGIFFYDLAILNIHNRCHLKTDLVWNQTHMVTNYNTCNYYYENGVNYGMLSSEITLDEMVEIKEKSSMKFFVNILGYSVMAHSKRKLLSHFFEFNQKKKEKEEYSIEENNKKYYIREDVTGNTISYGELLNGSTTIPTLRKYDFDYIVADEDRIDSQLFLEVLSLFMKVKSEEDLELFQKIRDKIGSYTGFFYEKTIYKVKKNEE